MKTNAASGAYSPASRRLDWLRRIQNRDGGWAYQAGRRSWVEPTVYALLALDAGNARAIEFQRGVRYLLSLQRQDGAWPASADVAGGHWTTSLCLTIGARYQWPEERLRAAARWLLDTSGCEGRLLARIGRLLDPGAVEYNPAWRGWSWTAGTSSWVEPTSHAIVALRAARPFAGSPALDSRIESAEQLLLDRRCSDGGWNYGNRRVRGFDLPAYPQTTAVALFALAGASREGLAPSLARATQMYAQSGHSALARAWLALALGAHGAAVDFRPSEEPRDTVTAALETLALVGRNCA